MKIIAVLQKNMVPEEMPAEDEVAPEEEVPIQHHMTPEEERPMEGEVTAKEERSVKREVTPEAAAPTRLLRSLACDCSGIDHSGVDRHGGSACRADHGCGNERNQGCTDHDSPPMQER